MMENLELVGTAAIMELEKEENKKLITLYLGIDSKTYDEAILVCKAVLDGYKNIIKMRKEVLESLYTMSAYIDMISHLTGINYNVLEYLFMVVLLDI